MRSRRSSRLLARRSSSSKRPYGLSIETIVSIELDVSKSRAKLDFPMLLTERLNDARYGAKLSQVSAAGIALALPAVFLPSYPGGT